MSTKNKVQAQSRENDSIIYSFKKEHISKLILFKGFCPI